VSANNEVDWVVAADAWAAAYWSDDGRDRDRVFRDEAPAWIARYCRTKDGELAVLAPMLEHPRRKWFVAFLAGRGNRLPRSLHEPMLRAGISEPNPSANRGLIEPCVAAWGAATGIGRLLDEVEHGADPAGAVQALYWAWGAAKPANEDERTALSALRLRERRLLIETFVHRTDVDLRRRIIPHLQLRDLSRDAEDLRALANEAITIARGHEDEYIRHRVEVQLGGEHLLMPLPPRPT
jgi:hypothetical protein